MFVALLVVGWTGLALALDKGDLEQRISILRDKFQTLQSKPDKAVPPEILRQALGIILLDQAKGGFIVGYEGGRGVAMVRESAASQRWSPLVFMQSHEGSVGFQIGGEGRFCVVLLMNTNALHFLTEPKFDFAGEARGTAGNDSKSSAKDFSGNLPAILVYDDRHGLYGGASIKGGAVSPDRDANRLYYGQAFTVRDILFDRQVQPTESTKKLAAQINQAAKAERRLSTELPSARPGQ